MLLYLLVTCTRTQMTDNTGPGAPDRHAFQKRQGLTGAACAGASRSATDHDEPEACGRLQSLVSYVVRELSMEDAGVDAHAVASGLQQHQISFEQLVDKSSAPVTSCATTLSELLLPHAPAGSSMVDLSFAVRIHVDGWVKDNQRDGPAGSKRQPRARVRARVRAVWPRSPSLRCTWRGGWRSDMRSFQRASAPSNHRIVLWEGQKRPYEAAFATWRPRAAFWAVITKINRLTRRAAPAPEARGGQRLS